MVLRLMLLMYYYSWICNALQPGSGISNNTFILFWPSFDWVFLGHGSTWILDRVILGSFFLYFLWNPTQPRPQDTRLIYRIGPTFKTMTQTVMNQERVGVWKSNKTKNKELEACGLMRNSFFNVSIPATLFATSIVDSMLSPFKLSRLVLITTKPWK